MNYDLVIRNGTIVDGSGAPAYRGDVGVVGDRIATIGKITDKAEHEIDAEGHYVTPGFVDGHTHLDAQVFWDQLGTNSCWHGVTSAVMGNCGFTLAPASFEGRELAVANLERAEDIARSSLEAGIDWTWTSFPEYLDAVDRVPKGLNYAANLGHSPLRTWNMGEAAFEREATPDELALMVDQVREAIRAGAVGFTTSRSLNHETPDDRPVASRLASWDEVRALVGVMGEEGRGVFEIANEDAIGSRDPDKRHEYQGRLRALALDTGVPVTFGLFASMMGTELLGVIDEVNASGGTMFGLTHCRGVGSVMSFLTRMPFDSFPEWKKIRSLPYPQQLAALKDPVMRTRLVDDANNTQFGRAIGAEARRPKYEHMDVMRSAHLRNTTVAQEASARGVDPVAAMIDIAIETELKALFSQVLTPQPDELLFPMLRHPATAMTFSDSGAHVSQIVDCSIQTYLLASMVRDREIFTWEEAVRMITSRPAAHWRLQDRGLLREGLMADLNVFDPATIAPDLPVVADDLPGGGRRYVQRATGIAATIVNGSVLIRHGEETGERPGRLLRGGKTMSMG